MPINREDLIPIDSEPKKEESKPVSINTGKINRSDLEPIEEPWVDVSGISNTLKRVGKVYPAFEVAANLMSSSYGVPISGLVGIAALPFGAEAANRAIEATQKFLVYNPKTEDGKQLLDTAMTPFKKIEDIGAAANKKLTKAGHPYLGMAADVGIVMAPALASMKGGLKTEGKIANKMRAEVDYGINKGVRPSVVNKEMASQRSKYMDNAKVAVEEIINNKENLKYVDSEGVVRTGLPKSLEDFSQAIYQTKQKIFEKYDAIAKQADNQGASVATQPVVAELQNLANDRVLQTLSPETIEYAAKRAKGLENKTFTTVETQNLIKALNQTDVQYRANPTPDMYGKAFVDNLIANNLRSGIDAAIELKTGAQYAPLKRTYGALRMLETDVTKRSIVDARKNPKALIDFGDVFSGSQITYGVFSGQPALIASGLTSKGIQNFIKSRNNPNRIVTKMFKNSDKLMNKPQGYRALPIGGTIATSLAGKIKEEENGLQR